MGVGMGVAVGGRVAVGLGKSVGLAVADDVGLGMTGVVVLSKSVGVGDELTLCEAGCALQAVRKIRKNRR